MYTLHIDITGEVIKGTAGNYMNGKEVMAPPT